MKYKTLKEKIPSTELAAAVIAGILVLVCGIAINHGERLSKLEAQTEILEPQIEKLESTNREQMLQLNAQMRDLESTTQQGISKLETQIESLRSQIQNLQSTVRELEGLEVSIVEPKNNAAVGCEITTEDNQCTISVDLEIAGILPEAARVRMLVRVEGGDEWWVSGGEGLPGPDNKCSIGFVTLGSADGPDQRYELMAIVTEQVLEPGSRHTVIPDHIARSPSVIVLARKGNE